MPRLFPKCKSYTGSTVDVLYVHALWLRGSRQHVAFERWHRKTPKAKGVDRIAIGAAYVTVLFIIVLANIICHLGEHYNDRVYDKNVIIMISIYFNLFNIVI